MRVRPDTISSKGLKWFLIKSTIKKNSSYVFRVNCDCRAKGIEGPLLAKEIVKRYKKLPHHNNPPNTRTSEAKVPQS